jgi:heat shock protein HtpX
MNSLRTAFLLGLLTVLLILIGDMIGGQQGAFLFFLIALGMNMLTYWFSDRIVLAMYGAQEVSRGDAPELYSMVEGVAMRAGMPVPRIYIIPTRSPNAFATGRSPSHAAVAVTEGILRTLSKDELEAVIAHEISHIKNRDILVATIAASIAGAITMIANWMRWAAIFGGFGRDDEDRGGALSLLFLAIIAPIAALLIQLAISRGREYMADEGSARITRRPLSLANALMKLEAAAYNIPMNANPATSHMFTVNPLRGGGIATLFSTHPSTESRIERLRKMAREMGQI